MSDPAIRPSVERHVAWTRWIGPAVIVATGISMARWSWLKWPDAMIDYGMQLYLAWQLAEGKSLYTDITYAYGPLAPYVMALGFRFFGASLMTLVGINLAVLCLITVLLYWLMLKIGSRFSATIATLIFLTVFAFAQLLYYGNYNYVTPYETNATFGMMLCLASMVCLVRFVETRSMAAAAASSFILGCVFLTKPELFLANACALIGGMALLGWTNRSDRRHLPRTLLVSLVAFLIAPAVSVVLLAGTMSVNQAVLGTLGSWVYVLQHNASDIRFFRVLMGTDDVASNAWQMGVWSVAYGVVFVPSAFVCLNAKRTGSSNVRLGIDWHTASTGGILVGMLTLAFAAMLSRMMWGEIGRPLPLILLISIGFAVYFLRGRRSQTVAANEMIIRLIMLIFSLVLLLKMILAVHFHHYGFVLAMPAMLVFVTIVLDWIPGWIDSRKGGGNAFRAVGVGVLLFIVLHTLLITSSYFSGKREMVSQGRDRFWAGDRGLAVNITLDEIRKHVKADQTLVPVPEGVMINYLARRVCPIPYVNLNPPNFTFFGEERILASFREHSPDFILIAHKDTSEFGYQYFGRDYAVDLFEWIRTNYEGIALIGSMPHHDGRFGIRLMQRRDLINRF